MIDILRYVWVCVFLSQIHLVMTGWILDDTEVGQIAKFFTKIFKFKNIETEICLMFYNKLPVYTEPLNSLYTKKKNPVKIRLNVGIPCALLFHEIFEQNIKHLVIVWITRWGIDCVERSHWYPYWPFSSTFYEILFIYILR